jgi:predicted Zn-dependent protease
VLLRDEHIARDAEAGIRANPDMSAADFKDTMDKLRDAEFLNPHTQWILVRANVLLLRDKAEAQRVADSVVESEPDNLAAWSIVAKATEDRDPKRFDQALAEIRRLNPPLPGS